MAINKDFRVKNGLVVEEGAIISGLSYPTTDGSEGHVLTTDGQGNLTFQLNPLSVTGEPMGFVNRADSTINFVDNTRTFQISPVNSSFEVWTKGVKRTITSTQQVTIGTTSGLYYIYFDADGVLQQQSAFFNLETQTPVAYVYWNATQSSASFIADERHGVVMDWRTHEYLHRTHGAQFASGFGASNYVIAGNGSLDAHMQLDLAGGTFYDEDLKIQITHSNTPTGIWEQNLQGPAKIPMFYLDGSGEWKIDTPTDFPLKQGVIRPQYNRLNAGVWDTQDIDDNNFGVTWILATNNIQYPIIGIIGQYYSDSEGQAEGRNFADLNLSGFPVVEYRPLYKLIYRCDAAYTNTPNARLQSIWDLRTIANAAYSTYNAADHGNLGGLGDDDHLQYVHVSEPRTISADHTFTGDLTLSGTSIGKLMDVNLSIPATNKQALIWDSATSKFIPGDSFSQTDFDNAISNVSIDDLNDVDISTDAPTTGQALIFDGTNFVPGDVTANFLGLTDTPDSYTGQNGKTIVVKSDASGIEFGDLGIGSQAREQFTSTSGQTIFTLSNIYGSQNSILVFVNGVPQFPGDNFTLSGQTLTFTSAPDTGSQVLVYGLTPITNEITPGDGTVTAAKLAASAYTRDIFTGNGSTATYNLSGNVGSPLAPFVFVGGILQDPVTHYNINVLTNPQTITFTENIANGVEITVVYGPVSTTGLPSDQTITFAKLAPSNFLYNTFTGNGAQTNFTLSQAAVLPQHLIVTVAGIPQTPDGTTYTVSNTTLTFSEAPANGAKIVVRFYGTPISIGTPADNTVSTAKIVDGAVTPAKLDRTYATPTDVSNAIAALVDTAPTTLDTLNELAAALNDDANFATTITNRIIAAEAAAVAMAIALG